MTPLRLSGRRTGALVATVALAVSGVALASAPAQAAADPRPVDIAGDWAVSQLTDGIVVGRYLDQQGQEVTYDDFGLTMDLGFALKKVNSHATAVTAINTAFEPRVAEAYDSFGTIYTGSVAKAAAFAETLGKDPEAYGGKDLIALLEENTADTAPIAGRIQNVNETVYPPPDFEPTPGDSANVFGQSFAVRALANAGSGEAAAALAFLLKQQCADGFFRLNLNPDKAALDQTCDGGDADASAPDTDATSIAVLQLSAVEGDQPTIAPALAEAKTWLQGAQRADGSFGGGPTTGASNTNSTGLAGQALAALGDTDAAADAAVWVRAHQVDYAPLCTDALSGEVGALGYNDAAVTLGRTAGITVGSEDQWRRATFPALPVLEHAPATTPALTLSAPSGFVRGGSTATYSVGGVVPGDKVCFTVLGTRRTVAAGLDGKATVNVAMPNVTADRPVSVRDRNSTTKSTSTQVLGPKTFKVTTAATVKRGAVMTVRVSGLKPGEKVRVNLRGVLRRSGNAGPNGVFVARFLATKPLGRASVSALGEFPVNRRGATTVTVVR